MSLDHVTVAERLTYGRPLDPELDATPIRLVPRPTTALIGRVLLASIFILSGAMKLINFDDTLGFMQAKGIPSTEAMLVIAALAELLGGLAILTGFVTRLAALGLILFMIPTTLIFHDFWNVAGPEQQMQIANFMKNVAIVGGLSMLVAYGAGAYSLDGRMRVPQQP